MSGGAARARRRAPRRACAWTGRMPCAHCFRRCAATGSSSGSTDGRFDFAQFYKKLSERDFVIYPGKLTEVDCFRVGAIS